MQQWEYFTTYVEADMRDVPAGSDNVPAGDHPRHSPHALIPRLNQFGAEGWELISIHPVFAGRNHDFVFPTGEAAKWGKHYFCAFRRSLS